MQPLFSQMISKPELALGVEPLFLKKVLEDTPTAEIESFLNKLCSKDLLCTLQPEQQTELCTKVLTVIPANTPTNVLNCFIDTFQKLNPPAPKECIGKILFRENRPLILASSKKEYSRQYGVEEVNEGKLLLWMLYQDLNHPIREIVDELLEEDLPLNETIEGKYLLDIIGLSENGEHIKKVVEIYERKDEALLKKLLSERGEDMLEELRSEGESDLLSFFLTKLKKLGIKAEPILSRDEDVIMVPQKEGFSEKLLAPGETQQSRKTLQKKYFSFGFFSKRKPRG